MSLIPGGRTLSLGFFFLWVLAQKYKGKKGKQRAWSLVFNPCLILSRKIAPVIQTRCQERQGEQVSTLPSGVCLVLERDMQRDSSKPLNLGLRKSLACLELEK